ncbi:aminopeptidase P family protein [Lichenibacterium dinghuense]|uniref:aminopeptidase P family protein n=1 Tax=Lichenibacterium dinghuense TaxID=2895977 RepID=UPI001F1D9119|nr:aminopeptidase P family protein [Lichenibacterium sp. 6Y81]
MFEARFQSFDESADPSQGPARLAALRAELKRRGLDGFVVPRADEHQNEYVPPAAERLAWLTGFTGSAGIAAVLMDEAAVFVDGRYTVQVRGQVDTGAFAPEPWLDHPPEAWLGERLQVGQSIGFDPWLHTPAQVERLRRAVEGAGATLVPVDGNPVDAVWPDRPAMPRGAVTLHPEHLAGRDRAAKVAAVAGELGEGETLLVSDPHAVAWLFNMRGADVNHTPLPMSYALVPKAGRPILWLDGAKLSNSVRDALEEVAEVADPTGLVAALELLGREGRSLRFDAATVPHRLVEALKAAGGRAEVGADPIALMKATKSEAERQGSRDAHRRDAAAFARFLHWFEREAPKGGLTEISCAEALESFRRDTGALKDVSFPSIAGFGPHAAIPHYRVTRSSNLAVGPGVFLIDSGGQYEDGTTDITRTLCVGEPEPAFVDGFTRVLKGHIAIARAVFPPGTTGAQLDPFARAALWRAGLDFDHGTGHGVGSYLSVHEGPQRIAKTGTTPLAEGMILSNEPGLYRAGQWGIRIENLILVERRPIPGGERPMLGFETLTFAPIQRNLIALDLLDRDEEAWIDDYHARVRDVVGPAVDPEVHAWLDAATRPLREG